jgi:hypothetical protein
MHYRLSGKIRSQNIQQLRADPQIKLTLCANINRGGCQKFHWLKWHGASLTSNSPMTSCSGLDSLFKYYLVVQSDLMHNLNFSNLGFTWPINTCCNFGHVTMHVVCGTIGGRNCNNWKNSVRFPLLALNYYTGRCSVADHGWCHHKCHCILVPYFCNIIQFWAHMSIAGNVHQHLSCIISSSFLASLFYICPFCWNPEKILE